MSILISKNYVTRSALKFFLIFGENIIFSHYVVLMHGYDWKDGCKIRSSTFDFLNKKTLSFCGISKHKHIFYWWLTIPVSPAVTIHSSFTWLNWFSIIVIAWTCWRKLTFLKIIYLSHLYIRVLSLNISSLNSNKVFGNNSNNLRSNFSIIFSYSYQYWNLAIVQKASQKKKQV